jgi:hypothetical protein
MLPHDPALDLVEADGIVARDRITKTGWHGRRSNATRHRRGATGLGHPGNLGRGGMEGDQAPVVDHQY